MNEKAQPDIADLGISIMQEVGCILEYAIAVDICSPLLQGRSNPLISAAARAAALLFVTIGETLNKRHSGSPLCNSWAELLCHRNAISHHIRDFLGEWDSSRMKQFRNMHGSSTCRRRLRALWDFVRWLDEQQEVPDTHQLAWISGYFYKGERAEAIAAMCNGILMASSLPALVTKECVDSAGTQLIAELEGARNEFLSS